MAKLVSDYMENHGTKFLRKCRPQNIEKLNDGKLKVSYKDKNGNDCSEIYDTVLMAVGLYSIQFNILFKSRLSIL
jgi:pyruvate/2-oxoglutarate dehydrogenase complex dihydrolipoamide dehydrogenase (E3) component